MTLNCTTTPIEQSIKSNTSYLSDAFEYPKNEDADKATGLRDWWSEYRQSGRGEDREKEDNLAANELCNGSTGKLSHDVAKVEPF